MGGLLVRGGWVLDPERPLEVADVRTSGDTIVEVGSGLKAAGEREVDASGTVVMPGLVNGHTHSGQSLDRGIAPPLPLDLWMLWVVYAGLPLTPDEVYTTAAAGAIDMLRTGCTSVLDHVYLDAEDFEAQAEAVMAAYADTGIRAGVAPMIQDLDFADSLPLDLVDPADRPPPISPPGDPGALLAHLEGFLDRWSDGRPRLIPMLGPTAPQRCSDEFLAGCAALARERGVGLHTHLLEARSQVFAARALHGGSTVDHLAELGALGPHASFAHGVWLDEREYGVLAASGSVLVHNPVSNLRCGSGVMPFQQVLAAGVTVALGADGAASNDGQNMFEVMKLTALVHTLHGDRRTWPDAEAVWRACLLGGAAALRQPVGRIRPGAKADLVVLSSDRHPLDPRDRLIRSLVVSELGTSVRTTICGGEVVFEEGGPTRIDEGELAPRVRALMERQAGHHADRAALYAQLEPAVSTIVDRAADAPLPFARVLPFGTLR